MKFHKSKGSALVDYVLPTALIGVVFGVALFGLIDTKIFQKFIEKSINGTLQANGTLVLNTASVSTDAMNSSSASVSTNNAPIANNTSSDPQAQTSTDSISLGNYSLTGMPENFTEFVETAGAAGGTEKLSMLILNCNQ